MIAVFIPKNNLVEVNIFSPIEMGKLHKMEASGDVYLGVISRTSVKHILDKCEHVGDPDSHKYMFRGTLDDILFELNQ